MMDTDSFLFGIETEDLFQDMLNYSHLFDTFFIIFISLFFSLISFV